MSRSPPHFVPPDFTGTAVLEDESFAEFRDGLLHGIRAYPYEGPNAGRVDHYEFGMLHSDTGPAVIHGDGRVEHWHRGRPRPYPDSALITAEQDRADREAMAQDFAACADPWGMPESQEQPETEARRPPRLLASKPEI